MLRDSLQVCRGAGACNAWEYITSLIHTLHSIAVSFLAPQCAVPVKRSDIYAFEPQQVGGQKHVNVLREIGIPAYSAMSKFSTRV